MNRESLIGNRKAAAILAALFVPLSTAHAAEGGDIAVLITGVTTVVIMMAMIFIIFVMNADIQPLTKGLASLKARFWSADYTEKKVGVDHDFDGITELDNGVPPWFNYLFYGSILFGLAYMLHFHVLGGKLSIAEYEDQIATASIERRIILANEGSIDENNLTVMTDDKSLTNGNGNFQKYCISCHAKDGGGIVGPNLTDEYWIHGGSVQNVYAVIKNGVAAKGMISWQLVFTPKQIQELASYVLSLQGKTPLVPKKPEGELWVAKPDTLKK